MRVLLMLLAPFAPVAAFYVHGLVRYVIDKVALEIRQAKRQKQLERDRATATNAE